jgi:sulfatase maturation enzyme AslB (radical SAM superfamily)
MERLAAEERQRMEEERKRLVEAQRVAVHEKAKKLGYQIKESRQGGNRAARPHQADVLMRLNLARIIQRSAANGPGERFVIWVQGCPLACPGCWNPDTWAFQKRELRDTKSVVEEILSVDGIEGVTFTGGEPFMQARAPCRSRTRGAGRGTLCICLHRIHAG